MKRTRNKSELGPRKHDDRTKEFSQNANSWLGSKAVKEKTPEKIRNDSKRRRVQKEGEWEIRRSNLEAYKLGSSSSSSSSNVDVFDSASSNMEQYKRRMAISYMMEIANYPHPDTWESLKLFSQIEERLVI